MDERFGLHFGALCEPVHKQLIDQGVAFDPKDCSRWQMIADAIVRLSVHGFLTSRASDACRRKLMKQISAGCSKS